jgi:hypothetical protein
MPLTARIESPLSRLDIAVLLADAVSGELRGKSKYGFQDLFVLGVALAWLSVGAYSQNSVTVFLVRGEKLDPDFPVQLTCSVKPIDLLLRLKRRSNRTTPVSKYCRHSFRHSFERGRTTLTLQPRSRSRFVS